MAIMASSPLKDNFKLYQKQFVERSTVYFPEWPLQEVGKFCNVLSLPRNSEIE
jgi:hypothetical protein